MTRVRRLSALACGLGLAAGTLGAQSAPRFPDLLLLSVDTLRSDRLSSAGYPRPTTTHLDRLLAAGFRFTHARTVEPLTNPALATLLTSVPPHVHGATRNGLPARAGLPSLPRLLAKRGYRTGAFLGNWTLKNPLSGLAPHWQTYEVVVSRKRWLGLVRDEARARDLTEAALDWVEKLRASEPGRPYALWIHYVEPHAPYRMHEELARRLGIEPKNAPPSDRYDTEVAAVDAEIGRLLAELDRAGGGRGRLTVFLVDHGEAFGEEGEQGHGRRLHEPTLRTPLGFVWPGRIAAGTSPAPASTLDVAPTVLALLGLPPHPYFRGADLGPALAGRPVELPPLCLQAHKGAVQSVQRAQRARRAGLLEVGLLVGGELEVVNLAHGTRRLYPLGAAAGERSDPVESSSAPSAALESCLEEIRAGLEEADRYVPPELDAESIEQLRALGYLD
ncbi:MAG TPA: sulfatase [Thermoanaerobaculia bacterium]|nr:sulfatase [Thermoanaerobaculia bacterium]